MSNKIVTGKANMLLVTSELEMLLEQGDGILKAEAVVEYAKNPDTALHNHFEWDDTEAARQYRLVQARHVVRVVLKAFSVQPPIVTRIFVSLPEDRVLPGGGYRAMVDVMSAEESRQRLLAQALKELEIWQQKYQILTELVAIFEAIAVVK